MIIIVQIVPVSLHFFPLIHPWNKNNAILVWMKKNECCSNWGLIIYIAAYSSVFEPSLTQKHYWIRVLCESNSVLLFYFTQLSGDIFLKWLNEKCGYWREYYNLFYLEGTMLETVLYRVNRKIKPHVCFQKILLPFQQLLVDQNNR